MPISPVAVRRLFPWQNRVFDFVLISCLGFVVLTALSMALYPGGTASNHATRGYAFFVNFFSDLGRTRTYNGTKNTFSALLFSLALSAAGSALALFFAALASLFWNGLGARVAAIFGAISGLVSGASFVGIAVTPANWNSSLHLFFVGWAFRAFLIAILPFIGLILTARNYPKIGAFVFLCFALGLVAYIQLLTVGSSPGTSSGLMIQVTGQKLIVYAAIGCVGFQAYLARRFSSRS